MNPLLTKFTVSPGKFLSSEAEPDTLVYQARD